MAIVETLEVRFQADMSRLGAQLRGVSSQIEHLSDALGGGRLSLAENARGMISAVGDALRSGANASAAPGEAGALLAGRFAGGIALGALEAAAAARSAAENTRFDSASALAGAINAGAALGQGFANGISSKHSAVMRAANRIAAAAVSRIRSALSIHSPSKVSFELGGYFGQGFAEGVNASVREAGRSALALSNAGLDALRAGLPDAVPADTGGIASMVQQAVSEALGGVNLVVPLHVDGMKLGQASINGINRVTRSTGRLMLEI